jgi:hypothetical protein
MKPTAPAWRDNPHQKVKTSFASAKILMMYIALVSNASNKSYLNEN